jgi:hypothetical protein
MAAGPSKTIDDQVRLIDELIARLKRFLPARSAKTVQFNPPTISKPPTNAEVAVGILGVIFIASFMGAMVFDALKFSLSGVPSNHFALYEDGRYFYVPRGGGLINERPQVPISQGQYRSWQTNSFIAGLFGLACVLSGGVASAVVIRARMKSRGSRP